MTLEIALTISIVSVIGMCIGSFMMGYATRGIHDANARPPDPPHTGWRKK